MYRHDHLSSIVTYCAINYVLRHELRTHVLAVEVRTCTNPSALSAAAIPHLTCGDVGLRPSPEHTC